MKNKTKLKRTLKELLFGLLCVSITALFSAFCAIFFSGGKNLKPSLAIFTTLCAAAAGLLPYVIRILARNDDEEKLLGAIDEIVKGNYAIEIPEVKPDLEAARNATVKLKNAFEFIDKAQSDFVNDFAHELKTPIVSIRGFAKLLAKGDASEEEIKEYASLIASESDRLLELTANTLMLDRLGAAAQVEKAEFDLAETARREILLLQEKWESKNIELIANLDETKVFSNEELAGQMLLNVIENAIKYTPENGKITVTVGKNERGAFAVIKDDGEGMDEETKLRMFDRYYRGDPSRQKGGNGLGLATVKKIAEVLGVKIKVESEKGAGTEFEFTF